jgi:pimeloyl-ACP methyl ester carboxylesterase
MPAPQIINIHGGLLPIKARMKSFTQFLVGMGYPEASIRNPTDGSCTYGYYDRSDRIAGAIAWYYERDGLRPMLVGHSMGGIQAIRVLHKLAGDNTERIMVWNPLTRTEEHRSAITDPLDGTTRPVVGLQVSYATAAVAGGLGRIVPNEWDMNAKLRKIPDSVEEFTGFQKGLDIWGGDFLGRGPANDYHAMGNAIVHNVRLRSMCAHGTIPAAKDLLNDAEIMQWIENYRPDVSGPAEGGKGPDFGLKSARIVYAAEVWFRIKKHWVIELQRLIRAKSPATYAN